MTSCSEAMPNQVLQQEITSHLGVAAQDRVGGAGSFEGIYLNMSESSEK